MFFTVPAFLKQEKASRMPFYHCIEEKDQTRLEKNILSKAVNAAEQKSVWLLFVLVFLRIAKY